MSVRPIVLLGDPRLRLKGETVDSFGKLLHELLDDLTATMRDAPGVGLAAPQLGEPLRACVVEVENHLYELVNPQIVRTDGDDRDLEGCLSIPGYVAYVTRHEKVWVVAQNRTGKKIKVAGSGLLGRALQHELDHLDGKLYIDYLDSMDELIAVGPGRRGRGRGGPRARRARSRDRAAVRRRVASGRSSLAAARSPSRACARSPRTTPSTLVAVVTAPPRPAGRRLHLERSPVHEAAASAPVLTPPRLRLPDAVAAILDLEPALVVLADYGQIVPPALLDPPLRGAEPPSVAAAAAPWRVADPGRDPRPAIARPA